MPKPSPMMRARGYGKVAELHEMQEAHANPIWRPVPGFPEYEVNQLRQVRRVDSKIPIHPYKYPMRPYEGEFVDFWVSGRKHIMSLETIMVCVFDKKEIPNGIDR